MIDTLDLTWPRVFERLDSYRDQLHNRRIWGIPRGGAVVAGLAAAHCGSILAEGPSEADLIVDDVIDSGRTRKAHPGPFLALVDKEAEGLMGTWVTFPWEERPEVDAEDLVVRQIEYLGEDVHRDGLRETPARVVRSWDEIYAGYSIDPVAVLKWFRDDTDEMVIARGIRFFSTCEHHLLPFYGYADVGYVPHGAIVGLSKLPRLVDAYARRLQTQEHLARQIGQTLQAAGKPKPLGVAVALRGHHLCAMARGVNQQSMVFETNYLTGVFRELPEARAEFLSGVGRS